MSAEILNGDGTQHGSVALLTCPAHYEVIGPHLLQCTYGKWDYDSTAPFCRGNCACHV